MENKTNWYILTHEKRSKASDTGPTKQHTDFTICLTIPKFKVLLQSTPMLREYNIPCKYTVFEVPDTPFQVKMCFLGASVELIEMYYLSTTPVTMKVNLLYTLGETSKNYSTESYKEIEENEWEFFESFGCRFNDNDDPNTDTLCLTFDFEVSQDKMKKEIVRSDLTSRINDDLGNLFIDGIYSDATVKSVDGVEFRVHKSILAARSKVLKAHFEHQTIESITNVVGTAWESQVLRDLLTFVYTDKSLQVDNDPAKILAAADYYQLERLKELCEEALKKRLTVENAIETLQLAELHSVDTLREYVLKFINNGRARLITETEGWANVKSVELIKLIYESVTAHEKETNNILAAAAAYI